MIDGKVEGTIALNGCALTIGPGAKVQAEIHDAGSVRVLGHLVGNIHLDGFVEVGEEASMEGDIRAPRIRLADGARFRGSIDMSGRAKATAKGQGGG